MNIRRTILATALAPPLAGPASAEGLEPAQAERLDLGTVSGVAYYTAGPDGFRVVATLAQPGEDATPMRFETVLAPGQSVVLSVPHGTGAAPDAVEISRHDDTVLVRKAAAAVTN